MREHNSLRMISSQLYFCALAFFFLKKENKGLHVLIVYRPQLIYTYTYSSEEKNKQERRSTLALARSAQLVVV
jgi:hypothetical protein